MRHLSDIFIIINIIFTEDQRMLFAGWNAKRKLGVLSCHKWFNTGVIC